MGNTHEYTECSHEYRKKWYIKVIRYDKISRKEGMKFFFSFQEYKKKVKKKFFLNFVINTERKIKFFLFQKMEKKSEKILFL